MRQYVRLVLIALVVSAFVSPFPAHAQERKGFWFGFDVGAASVGASAAGVDGSREWGGLAGFAGGWAIHRQLLAGIDMRLAAVDLTGDLLGTFDIYNVSGRLTYYPRPSSGLFLKGTIGGSFIDVTFEDRGTTFSANLAKGFGLGAGVGYDWYLGRGFSLTPALTYWHGRPGAVRFLGETLFTDWTHNVVDLTIGVSFH